jgi:hypothetical protein
LPSFLINYFGQKRTGKLLFSAENPAPKPCSTLSCFTLVTSPGRWGFRGLHPIPHAPYPVPPIAHARTPHACLQATPLRSAGLPPQFDTYTQACRTGDNSLGIPRPPITYTITTIYTTTPAQADNNCVAPSRFTLVTSSGRWGFRCLHTCMVYTHARSIPGPTNCARAHAAHLLTTHTHVRTAQADNNYVAPFRVAPEDAALHQPRLDAALGQVGGRWLVWLIFRFDGVVGWVVQARRSTSRASWVPPWARLHFLWFAGLVDWFGGWWRLARFPAFIDCWFGWLLVGWLVGWVVRAWRSTSRV